MIGGRSLSNKGTFVFPLERKKATEHIHICTSYESPFRDLRTLRRTHPVSSLTILYVRRTKRKANNLSIVKKHRKVGTLRIRKRRPKLSNCIILPYPPLFPTYEGILRQVGRAAGGFQIVRHRLWGCKSRCPAVLSLT